jgi:hypothetical protein
MFRSNTFIKATATTLAACMLMACGADDDDSTEEIKYKLSLASADAGEAGIIGKSIYKINVKDLDGIAVYGETPSIKPMMDMTEGMAHGAPNVGCTETDDQGSSDCTVYFPMASGMDMGTWTVGIDLANAETLSFSPDVSEPTGELTKAMLKGTSDAGDTIEGISRTYLIFNTVPMPMEEEAPMPDAHHMAMAMPTETTRSVELFIATKEGMNFPTLSINTTLSEGTEDALIVNSIDVLVSADKDAAAGDWVEATPDNKGTWTADIDGFTDTFYVKLSVNGDAKKINNLDYATFDKDTESDPMPDMNH